MIHMINQVVSKIKGKKQNLNQIVDDWRLVLIIETHEMDHPGNTLFLPH